MDVDGCKVCKPQTRLAKAAVHLLFIHELQKFPIHNFSGKLKIKQRLKLKQFLSLKNADIPLLADASQNGFDNI
jgi:hypothetical protein